MAILIVHVTSPAEDVVDELADTILAVKNGIFLDDGEF